ncbi:MAG: hypothetical protein SOY63_04710 [Alloprevotella sp.]|nr:hypothetical protein [Alloprevotella sp.]
MKGMKEPRKKSINLQKNFYGFGCKNSATSRIADAVLSKNITTHIIPINSSYAPQTLCF